MKTASLALLASFLLLVCLSPQDSRGQTPATSAPSAPSAPGARPGAQNRHPALHAAIAALEKAKAELASAPHDFGGHRNDAISACDNAINQINLALQSANASP